MERDEKLIDGPELERDAGLREAELQAQDEEQLPEIAGELQRDPALEHRSQLLGAMRMILGRETLIVSQLGLPQREQRALEALQIAVTGKSKSLDQFVFAEDRTDMLEQALAVLQANLTRGDDRAIAELHAKFGTLVEQVAHLRHELKELADSQDELLEGNQQLAKAEASDSDDKPKPPVDPDAPKPASTLTGPELPAEPAPPTTLTGPEPPAAPPPPSTLTGPEPPPAPEAASSVWDADTPIPAPPIVRAQELQPRPEADARTREAKGAEPKKPWWRRPFG